MFLLVTSAVHLDIKFVSKQFRLSKFFFTFSEVRALFIYIYMCVYIQALKSEAALRLSKLGPNNKS